MSCNCQVVSLPVGPAGTDGENAYSETTANFTQPAVSANVTVSISEVGQFTAVWAQPGQVIFIETGGYYTVVSAASGTMTITNLGYSGNAAPAATINTGSGVSPAGIKGDTGAAGSNGSNGTNGTNGTTVLEVDITEHVTDQTTYAAVQKSHTVAADTWETVDDVVRLEAMFVSDDTTTGYYTIRVELDGNTIDMIITLNDLYIVGKQNFAHLIMDFALTASGEITPILDSGLGTGGDYSNNQSADLNKYIRRCTTITGLTTSGTLDIDVSMVSSAGGGKNIKMFYYKLISMKK
jgi:hypothetical protein